ncbi:hypothetical protein [Bradyrhizobium sp. dw_78]|uniref:hypothetical protein n=1 Tax=Bradyrhizobium sp. dw_78 TaxID=2719793 RepID=UPI001BD43E93|nr:hypothetical protein [Bradyrhizobium sp. dw_78]
MKITKLALPILAFTITALNLGVLMLNFSVRAKADVAGKDWFELVKDDDFRQAVGFVVSKCTIDEDSGPPKILCGR